LAWAVTIETDAGAVSGRTTAISEGGALITVDQPLPVDHPLHMAIEVDALSHVILTEGEVSHQLPAAGVQEPPYLYSVRFLTLSDEDRRCCTQGLSPEWWLQDDSPTTGLLRAAARQHPRLRKIGLAKGETTASPAQRRLPGAATRNQAALAIAPNASAAAPSPPARQQSRRPLRLGVLLGLAVLAVLAAALLWSWRHFHVAQPTAPPVAAESQGTPAKQPAGQSPQPAAPRSVITIQPLQEVPAKALQERRETPPVPRP